MKWVHDAIREHALACVGVTDQKPCRYTFEELWERNWCPEFERLMRAKNAAVGDDFLPAMRRRLVVGELRYGRERPLCAGPWEGSRVDLLPGLLSKWTLYLLTLNHEYLVDIANYDLLSWVSHRPHYNTREELEEEAAWCSSQFKAHCFQPTDRCDAHHAGR
jgi:hypothetical protein